MQREQELADGLERLVKSYVGRGQVEPHDAELILQYQAQQIREEEGSDAFDRDAMRAWLGRMMPVDEEGGYQNHPDED